jgi:RNA polymerase sigma factor (sigma-70 family)
VDGPGASDAELLERFVRGGDQTAFELIVRRHEHMVFGVCRRILHDRQDAEDAFQATFLALARKAASIRRREAVSGWLYRVACRVALQARVVVARRRKRESLDPGLDSMPAPMQPTPESLWRDLRPVLDEELCRLPEKLRVPVVLCYLERRSYAEAATVIGCTKGTLSGRLARARALLADRLGRRGIGISGALLASALWSQTSAEAARQSLRAVTILAAARVATGEAAIGVVPASVAKLAEGVVRAMFMTKVKLVAGVLAAALAFTGVAGLSYTALASRQPPGQRAEQQIRSEPPNTAPDQQEGPKPAAADGVLKARAKLLLEEAKCSTSQVIVGLPRFGIGVYDAFL